MPRDTGLDSGEKQYLAELHEKYSGKELIDRFQQKYGWIPEASEIAACKEYKKEPEPEPLVKDDGLEIITDDTRKVKGVIDFSSGEIPDEQFDALCLNCGKTKAEMFNLLHQAYERGYTKVNIETGDLSK